jgi:hypothetical protein
MIRLLNIGFVIAGKWNLNNNNLNVELTGHQKCKNVLYSFVSDGVVKYIGKSTLELTKRMYGYQNPGPSQSTNIRISFKIKELLSSNNYVDILVLPENSFLKYGDFKINLAAGLEDTLIYEINPEWNFTDKSVMNRIKKDLMVIKVISFEIILGIAYYNQGFFNVSMAYNEIFGYDKSLIEIQLGENPENKIQGYVNRTANSNGTPRIMGGKVLTEWIKKHYRQGDLLRIDILSNDSIKLNEKI